ncbi:uncharacterized protein LOC126814629 isoform X2 [Patella vulgata]|uniref:uncharacterized protein LOC126814629 isoform X2 n=1 Tax=Patella vulgata TaxID=6465 RepID=UPI00217FC729|nr:uncharacterized protein LOC126814629 isoform X2 [Patella vulgata]
MAMASKARYFVLKVCALFFVIILQVHCDDVPSKEEACGYWKRIADQMSNQSQQMHCVANSTDPCTRLDCQGTYKYRSWMIPTSTNIEIDFCFGIVLNHCDEPVALDIYLQIPKRNVSYQSRVRHDELMKIPGGSITTASFGKVDAFLYFHMVKTGSFVNFSMVIKLKITALGGFSMWPPGLQRTLVPNERIPVPPCEHPTNDSAVIPPPVCQPPHWRQISGHVPQQSVTPGTNPSVTFNKTCSDADGQQCAETEACNEQINICVCYDDFVYDKTVKACVTKSRLNQVCDFNQKCGPSEVCKEVKGQNSVGRCACKQGFHYSIPRQICDAANQDTFTVMPGTTAPDANATKKQPLHQTTKAYTNTTAVIAGCVSAVIILTVIVIVVFMMIRKKRSQYDRQILLENDDEPLAI